VRGDKDAVGESKFTGHNPKKKSWAVEPAKEVCAKEGGGDNNNNGECKAKSQIPILAIGSLEKQAKLTCVHGAEPEGQH
jgi:hypothetical protein